MKNINLNGLLLWFSDLLIMALLGFNIYDVHIIKTCYAQHLDSKDSAQIGTDLSTDVEIESIRKFETVSHNDSKENAQQDTSDLTMQETGKSQRRANKDNKTSTGQDKPIAASKDTTKTKALELQTDIMLKAEPKKNAKDVAKLYKGERINFYICTGTEAWRFPGFLDNDYCFDEKTADVKKIENFVPFETLVNEDSIRIHAFDDSTIFSLPPKIAQKLEFKVKLVKTKIESDASAENSSSDTLISVKDGIMQKSLSNFDLIIIIPDNPNIETKRIELNNYKDLVYLNPTGPIKIIWNDKGENSFSFEPVSGTMPLIRLLGKAEFVEFERDTKNLRYKFNYTNTTLDSTRILHIKYQLEKGLFTLTKPLTIIIEKPTPKNLNKIIIFIGILFLASVVSFGFYKKIKFTQKKKIKKRISYIINMIEEANRIEDPDPKNMSKTFAKLANDLNSLNTNISKYSPKLINTAYNHDEFSDKINRFLSNEKISAIEDENVKTEKTRIGKNLNAIRDYLGVPISDEQKQKKEPLISEEKKKESTFPAPVETNLDFQPIISSIENLRDNIVDKAQFNSLENGLKETISKLDKRLENMEDKIKKGGDGESKKIKKKLENTQETLSTTKKQLDDLNKSLSESRATNKQLTKEIEEMRSDVNEKQKLLERKAIELDKVKNYTISIYESAKSNAKLIEYRIKLKEIIDSIENAISFLEDTVKLKVALPGEYYRFNLRFFYDGFDIITEIEENESLFHNRFVKELEIQENESVGITLKRIEKYMNEKGIKNNFDWFLIAMQKLYNYEKLIKVTLNDELLTELKEYEKRIVKNLEKLFSIKIPSIHLFDEWKKYRDFCHHRTNASADMEPGKVIEISQWAYLNEDETTILQRGFITIS